MRGLFDPPVEEEVAEVRLNDARFERVREFGAVWPGSKLWRMAKFDEFSEEHMPAKKAEVGLTWPEDKKYEFENGKDFSYPET